MLDSDSGKLPFERFGLDIRSLVEFNQALFLEIGFEDL